MANDADQIVVGSNGSISVAPKGTTPPEDLEALTADFTNLGLVTPDGAAFSDSKTLENIGAWQAFGPVRRVVTEKDTQLTFGLRQWNKDTVPLAFGGGDVTEPETGVYRYSPAAAEELDERCMVLDWQDKTFKYRLVIVEGMVTEGVETNLVRTGAADLPITFGANYQADDDTWYLITDDPAFEPDAS